MWPSNFPDLILIKNLWDVLYKQIQSGEALSLKLTGLKECATLVIVKVTPVHLERSFGDVFSGIFFYRLNMFMDHCIVVMSDQIKCKHVLFSGSKISFFPNPLLYI